MEARSNIKYVAWPSHSQLNSKSIRFGLLKIFSQVINNEHFLKSIIFSPFKITFSTELTTLCLSLGQLIAYLMFLLCFCLLERFSILRNFTHLFFCCFDTHSITNFYILFKLQVQIMFPNICLFS